MFGGAKVKLDSALWEKVRKYSKLAGYASPEEFVTDVLEKEFATLEEADSDENIREKLKGLGYIN